ncbi:hypothetical protein BDF20DRAFT_987867 [Mycotypha africana]|uniref:uncharacterized protein n=1 Tax=Mycotypha africana TaxID=64632 RepID=UPI002300B41E|nr:uncharacterized protein BDF20DRAFT_987867 [Mycotypha africana]KAI8979652.1 hypothetical protein BDF20DRAFT_987867 [Mycotypha africana]
MLMKTESYNLSVIALLQLTLGDRSDCEKYFEIKGYGITYISDEEILLLLYCFVMIKCVAHHNNVSIFRSLKKNGKELNYKRLTYQEKKIVVRVAFWSTPKRIQNKK